MCLKENSFLGVHVATKLIVKAASEQIWNSTKPWYYQTTRAEFWQYIWVVSTKDNRNKTVVFFYTKTSVDICSNSSISESLKPLKDFQISVHKKCEGLIFYIMDRHPKQMSENTLQKILWIWGKRKPEIQHSPQVRDVDLDNEGTKTNNHQLMPEYFFRYCFPPKFS